MENLSDGKILVHIPTIYNKPFDSYHLLYNSENYKTIEMNRKKRYLVLFVSYNARLLCS